MVDSVGKTWHQQERKSIVKCGITGARFSLSWTANADGLHATKAGENYQRDHISRFSVDLPPLAISTTSSRFSSAQISVMISIDAALRAAFS
jgi:hypothetical protein